MGKYWRLTEYLKNLDHDTTLAFDEMGDILGFPLPDSATLYAPWWHGGSTHTQTRGWEDAGWSVVKADRDNKRVTFKRNRSAAVADSVPREAPHSSPPPMASPLPSGASAAAQLTSSLILIPCSDRKRPGGEPSWRIETTAPSALGSEGEWLWEARRAMASLLGQTAGPDLGLDGARQAYLPALKRYDGLLYQGVAFELWSQEERELLRDHCLIVSGLYGLITPAEPIRDYNVSMKDRLADGQLIKRWWRDRGLGDVLKTYVANEGITDVFCFLSNDYLDAFGGLDVGKARLHRFPCAQGTGSLRVQGRAVAQLVREGQCTCVECRRDDYPAVSTPLADPVSQPGPAVVSLGDEMRDGEEGDDGSPVEQGDLRVALEALDEDPIVISASEWPHGLHDLDSPGLYCWWVDGRGACELSAGLGLPVYPGRIYAGQTGAGSSSSTLHGRIGGNHLRGSIEGSTLRLTLGAVLAEQLSLEKVGRKKFSADSEARLSSWMAERLSIAVYPFSDRQSLGDLEARVVSQLDPPLNLDHCDRSTPLRARLKDLRRSLAAWQE